MAGARLTVLMLVALVSANRAYGQWKQARSTSEGVIQVLPFEKPPGFPMVEWRDEAYPQLEGFPMVAVANKTFKNFRNVTLADVDGRPGQEILWTADNRLMAMAFDGVLWSKELQGVGIYPPSVADLDQDGVSEIVQVTGGQSTGRVYVMDLQGNDLPGWPLNLNDNWIAAAPCLADVDGDGHLEIIVNELQATDGLVHLLRHDGTPFSEDWPVRLDARPAVTPSVADMDGDGQQDIVVFSTRSRYILGLDGQPLPGFPQVTHPAQRYSFQSPIVAALREGEGLSVVGATHGEGDASVPQYFAIGGDGGFRPGWPVPIPEGTSTFGTPTVVDLPGAGTSVLIGRPLTNDDVDGMLYGFTAEGELLPGFPIVKPGGLEGIISVADADGDGAQNLVFGSNLLDGDGYGFLHAYSTGDSPVELPGFPLRPRGFTYLNGATLGDVNGDDSLDLVALSYVQRFGLGPDSLYLNVYSLGVKLEENTILWGTYKGDNTRRGLVGTESSTPVNMVEGARVNLSLQPNPAGEQVEVRFLMDPAAPLRLALVDAAGRVLEQRRVGAFAGEQSEAFGLNNLPPGMYWISVSRAGKTIYSAPFIHR